MAFGLPQNRARWRGKIRTFARAGRDGIRTFAVAECRGLGREEELVVAWAGLTLY